MISDNVWIITGAVVLTIVLNIVCGVKVMNLEEERNQLRVEKVTLDQRAEQLNADIASHTKLLQDLPELTSRHIEVVGKIADVEGKLRDLTSRQTSLAQNISIRGNELQEAIANRNQAEATTNSAREEAGRLQSKIGQLESSESTLGLKVETLEQDSVALESRVAESTTRLQGLNAEIEGLIRRKDAKIADLEQLTKDNGRLVIINSQLKVLAEAMDVSRQKSENAVSALEDSAKNAQQAVTELASNARATGQSMEGLNSSGEKLDQLLEKVTQDRGNLKTIVSDLAKAGSDAKKQVQRLTTQLDDPMRRLNKGIDALTRDSEKVEVQLNAILNTHDLLEKVGEQLETSSTRLTSTQTSLEQNIEGLLNNGERLQIHVTDLVSTVQNAGTTMSELNTSKEKFSQLLGKIGEDQSSLNTTVAGLVRTGSDAEQKVKHISEQLEVPIKKLNDDVILLNRSAQNISTQVDEISQKKEKLALSGGRLEIMVDQFKTFQESMDLKKQKFESQLEKLVKIVASAEEGVESIHSDIRKIANGSQNISTASTTLDAQIQSVKNAMVDFTELINAISPKGSGEGVENFIELLKGIIVNARTTLADVKALHQETASAVLVDGENLKTVLGNLVRDIAALEKEMKIQMEIIHPPAQSVENPQIDAEVDIKD